VVALFEKGTVPIGVILKEKDEGEVWVAKKNCDERAMHQTLPSRSDPESPLCGFAVIE